MKKILIILVLILSISTIAYQFKPVNIGVNAVVDTIKPNRLINEEGLTIKSRVKVPEGFKRVNYPKQSFEDYLRNYQLKSFGSKIINFDGTEYFWQLGHIGVLDIPVPKNGLQQCADALIRVRSEYLWDNNRKEEIGFNFTSGDYCSWKYYAEGYRPKINGNKVTFNKIKGADHTKTNFYKYLNLIYTYSGTLSLYNELPKINIAKNLKIGDMLIKGGLPGHIVMICDEAVNEKGEKVYLLFQGNTPAQSVHLVKNLEDTSISPWYKLEQNQTISVSNYTFSDSKFVRFK
ncbi:MAG: DUF4846 domain-containing protein [Aestuariibaculum sp.]